MSRSLQDLPTVTGPDIIPDNCEIVAGILNAAQFNTVLYFIRLCALRKSMIRGQFALAVAIVRSPYFTMTRFSGSGSALTMRLTTSEGGATGLNVDSVRVPVPFFLRKPCDLTAIIPSGNRYPPHTHKAGYYSTFLSLKRGLLSLHREVPHDAI